MSATDTPMPQIMELLRQGQLAPAEQLLRQRLAAGAADATTLLLLGQVLIQTRRSVDAIEPLTRARAADPNLADVPLWLGIACDKLADTRAATAHLADALRLLEGQPQGLSIAGQVLLANDRPREAIACLDQVRLAAGDQPELVRALGIAYQALRQEDRILESLDTLARQRPDDPAVLRQRTSLFERMGDLDRARAEAEKLLAIRPHDPVGTVTLAKIERSDKDPDRALERLRAAEPHASPGARADLKIEAAHALDALGRYDEAWNLMVEGQALWAELPAVKRYDPESYLRWVRSGPQWLTPERIAAFDHPPADREPPIFFVGFPRSGTTLTEQILGAHPDLATSDERSLMWRAMEAIRLRILPGSQYPESMGLLDAEGVHAARDEYWAFTEDQLGATELRGKRLVDKRPLATWTLPMVRRLFPDSPVLFALRDPRDVVLSGFFQRFNPNHGMAHFASIESTVRLYDAVMDGWLRMRDMLGMRILETRYESLVHDVEAHARKLIEFLGLPWSDEVLDFQREHKTRFVSTPSYAAVLKPVSTRAIGRWKNYAKQLEPVLPTLERYVKEFGYE
ncbi:MAG: tetratricopeptide repeat-containing sulfotransferase family protein [Phycisphaerales bacterium JB037]